MSAFVVSNECLQRAVTAMAHVERLECSVADQLGQAMLHLNASAVEQRYGSKAADMVAKATEDATAFRWKLAYLRTQAERADALKGLQCLIYQCSEGNVTESALYARMGDAEHRLMSEIIDDLPEYQRASWD